MPAPGHGRSTVRVGLLYRRQVRRQLQTLKDVTFTEDRGPIDSQFVLDVKGSARYAQLMDWFRRIHEEAVRATEE
jgi:hypothetical protein